MENKAILAEWGHLVKGFDSQMAELGLDVAGPRRPLKVSNKLGTF